MEFKDEEIVCTCQLRSQSQIHPEELKPKVREFIASIISTEYIDSPTALWLFKTGHRTTACGSTATSTVKWFVNQEYSTFSIMCWTFVFIARCQRIFGSQNEIPPIEFMLEFFDQEILLDEKEHDFFEHKCEELLEGDAGLRRRMEFYKRSIPFVKKEDYDTVE